MASTDKTAKRDEQERGQGAQTQSGQQMTTSTQGRRSGALARPGREMGLGGFGPFSMMRRLFEDLERFTGGPLESERRQLGGGGAMLGFMPNVDVTRRDDRLMVQVDLPGLAPEDVRVTVDEDALIIEGERRSEQEFQEGDVWRAERTYGRFQRVIPLPDNADTNNVEARFENGVLEISVRAPEQRQRGKQIEIKSGSQPSQSQKTTTSH